MARQVGIARLTALAVSRLVEPGTHADGGGLYLQIRAAKNGQDLAKSWLFRYMLDGRRREMGLGSFRDVNLAEARKRATKSRELCSAGIDPLESRDKEKAKAQLDAAKGTPFRTAAIAYVEAHKSGWRNEKHTEQWLNTFEAYVFPLLGDLSVQEIDTNLVLKVLEPIWHTKTVTADRVRQRIEAVLSAATARGQRHGDNPARWRGHLDNLLPRRSKVHKVTHHPALPYDEVAAFVDVLRKENGVAARALEFLILTAARTGEVRGAKWNTEIDLEKAIWIVPADRIKGGKEHRVPLSSRALAILREVKEWRTGDYVFPGGKPDEPLSSNGMLSLLRRIGRPDLTAHGFRSTFRDWTAEHTNYPREVAEMALAHVVENKVEAAYRRGDLFEKRRRLMDDWSRYCEAPPAGGSIVPIRSKSATSAQQPTSSKKRGAA